MTSDPAPLDPTVKVDLWRQRFFEAQAAAEEFILGMHGDEGVSAWIQANSRITVDLLRSQRPAGESATAHFMARLQRQLLLYDSAVTSEPQPSGTVLRNTECGILRYRKLAAGAGVKLTFASPCQYCQELNTAIAARYVESDVTVSCEQAGDGCTWRAESQQASGDGAAGSPDRGGT
ncbi:hypothetical protein [Verrucosispora sioxanthis]|uniref:L-2-amino-thiazoline-4-carboxylic acid hydrolase n=1 Tax=Verrucosispora sioxanthis TaxID=2499994 RepID=A0A6M1L1N9_9ACTN|nr:hypothetical protein [Verrucosispora sioxanthis]NEE62917.1 hypothetical protein [Verrucosispora sioxanthis]NGM12027.1 hypothetical protein [Verrucosispora sioxanthis]